MKLLTIQSTTLPNGDVKFTNLIVAESDMEAAIKRHIPDDTNLSHPPAIVFDKWFRYGKTHYRIYVNEYDGKIVA